MCEKLFPPLRYPGSKWNIVDWIISFMPEHHAYLEPFIGGGSVLFSKKPVGYETINDLNGDVVNLFKVIREQPERLAEIVAYTPYSRAEFDMAWECSENIDELERARIFLVKCWQGFGARLSSKPGWSCEVKPGGRYNSIVNRWNRVPEAIMFATNRLKNVQIENMDAIKLIKRYQNDEILIYADPPYLSQTRTGGKYYSNEMADDKHIELLETLKKHKGPVLLSGYDSDLYNNLLKGWTKKQLSTTTEKGQTRIETLWLNPVVINKLEKENNQLNLFKESCLLKCHSK